MYNKELFRSPLSSSISFRKCVLPLFYIAANLILPLPAYTLSADIRATNTRRVQEYNSEQAKFGPAFPVMEVSGLLIEAKPLNACQQIYRAPSEQIDNYQYFALIEQGGCDFENKVYNAQIANFDGVIIFNNKDNQVYQMQGNGRHKIEIPSTFLGKDAGLDLLQNFTWREKFEKINANVVIKGEFIIPLKCYLIPFVVIVGVCFLVMLLFVLFKLIRDHRAKLKNRLSRRGLKKLPTRKWKKGCEECVDWESCAICLEDYEDGHKLRVLPCHHAFHCKCIDPWLTETRRVCPLCKRRINPRGQLEDPTPPSSPNPSTYNNDDEGDDAERTDEANEHDRDLSTSAPDFLSAARQSASRARRSRRFRDTFYSNNAYEQDEDLSDCSDDASDSNDADSYDDRDDCPLLNGAADESNTSAANQRRRSSGHSSSSSDSASTRSSWSGGALSRVFQGLVKLKGQSDLRSGQTTQNVVDAESSVGKNTNYHKNARNSSRITRTSQHLDSQNAENEDKNDVQLLLAGNEGEGEPGPSSGELVVEVGFKGRTSNSTRSNRSSVSVKSSHSADETTATSSTERDVAQTSAVEVDDSSDTITTITISTVAKNERDPSITKSAAVDANNQCDVKLLDA